MGLLKKVFGRQIGTIYEDGEVLFTEGEPPNSIYSIVSGEVDFFTKKGRKVLTITTGSFVGIAYLFGCKQREFTAIINGPTTLLKLDKKLLTERIHQDPSLAFTIMQEMAKRYREIIGKLAQE
jgi:CRP-like cAMP-binding protein